MAGRNARKFAEWVISQSPWTPCAGELFQKEKKNKKTIKQTNPTSPKEFSFVFKFPKLHLYSNSQFSKFQQKTDKVLLNMNALRVPTWRSLAKKKKEKKEQILEKKMALWNCMKGESKHWTVWVWRKIMYFGRLWNSHCNSKEDTTENWVLLYLSSQ